MVPEERSESSTTSTSESDSTHAPASPRSPCLDCGGQLAESATQSELAAPYCPHCGQKVAERLTLGDLWHAFAGHVLNLEGGLLHTFVELLRSPGTVVRHYLAGRRRSYVNPYAYLLLCAAISLLAFNLVGGVDAIELRQDLSERTAAIRSDLTPAQQSRLVEASVAMTQHTTLWSLLLSIPLALLLRLFYLHTFNLAEGLVFSLYLMAQVFLLDLSTYVLFLFTSRSSVHLAATQAVYVIAAIWFGATFSSPRWLGALKSLGAFLLAFLVFSQLMAIGLEVWVRAS